MVFVRDQNTRETTTTAPNGPIYRWIFPAANCLDVVDDDGDETFVAFTVVVFVIVVVAAAFVATTTRV